MKSLAEIRLYCFSPGPFLNKRDPLEIVASEIKGGADVIQLREKAMARRDRLELGLRIRELTRREGVLFVVNDEVDMALMLDADGVHLGQDDIPVQHARPLMKDRIIGVSTHSLGQAREAIAAGADYIGVGPVFETSTKADRDPLVGLELISSIREMCTIPYVAIGGIGKDNIESLVKAGCNKAAVISDILGAPDIERRCRLLKDMLS